MFGLRVILITDNIPIGAEVRTRFIGTTSSRGDFFSNLESYIIQFFLL